MLNKVQQLFIGKAAGAVSTTLSTGTLVTAQSEIVLGDLFIVNSNLKVIAAASDITPTIYVAQGTAAGTFKMSAPIQVSGITNIKSQAYQAQAQKVICLGNIGSATLDLEVVDGKTYRATVLIKDDQRFMPQRQTRRDYSFTTDFAATTPTDAEKEAFLDQFVDAINADPYLSDFVIAARTSNGSDYGISITGLAQTFNALNNRPEYVDFLASFYDVTDSTSTYQGTVTVTAGFVPGHGTPSQVIALENKLLAWEGRTNRTQFPVIEPTKFASSSTNYDIINIDWFNETPGSLEGRDKKPFGVIIPVCTASAQAAQLIAVIELLNNAGAGTISNNTSFVDADV
jgi:hypothetical protein